MAADNRNERLAWVEGTLEQMDKRLSRLETRLDWLFGVVILALIGIVIQLVITFLGK